MAKTYFVSITLTDIAGNTALYDNNGNFLQFVAQPPATVLLVNDYTEFPVGTESLPIPVSEYTGALHATGVTYDVWDVATLGSPRLDTLSNYQVVMWRINDDFWALSDDVLDPTERTTIETYLAGGGGFFMASMEIASRLGDVSFRTNVLNIAEFTLNPDPFGEPCEDCNEDVGVPVIVGEPSDSISRDVVASLDYSDFPVVDLSITVIGPDLSDTFVATTNAASVFYDINDATCGVRYPRTGQDSPGRVVFFSFPLEAIPRDGSPSGRDAILGNALRFLAPGLNGLGTIALDNFEYTIPDQVIVEVADSDLEGQGTMSVTAHSGVIPAGVDLTLFEI